MLPPDLEHAARSQVMIRSAERRKIKAAKIMKRSTDALRGAQVPNSKAEAKFKQMIATLGGLPHRPSWPDFLVEIDGKIVAVEVKKDASDTPTAEQRRTFDLLERAGLRVYLWRPKTGKARRWGAGTLPAEARARDLQSPSATKPNLTVIHSSDPAASSIEVNPAKAETNASNRRSLGLEHG